MNFYRINLLVWGSIIAIGALFVIPFLLLDVEEFLNLMPWLMTGLFAVIILIVGIVMYKVFIGAGRKRAAAIEGGEDAEATIISLEDTGVTLQDGLYFQVKFNLEVRPLTGSTFTTSVKEYVSRVSIAQYQPGTVVKVRYNPRKHEEIAIVGASGGTQAQAGTSVAEPVFASDASRGAAVAPGSTGRSSRGLMLMIALPLLVSVVALVLPLLALSKKDTIAGFFIEKTVGKYEMTTAAYVDGYSPAEETIFEPDGGNKWVMVTLTVKNTGNKKMDVSRTQLQLVTEDGSEYTPYIVVDTGNDFDARDLQPGASYSGNIVYEVPASAIPSEIKNIWDDRAPLAAGV